ncbi:MAG: hypothetical protein M3R17_16145 [Bacteroidota bacterium]|nr:hypothetical protein [Bacteroidota bacterium]
MISRFFILVVVLVFFCGCGNAEKPIQVKPNPIVKPKALPQKSGLIYAHELIKPKRNSYDDARARIGDTLILCSYKGRIDFADSTGKNRVSITDLRCEFHIEKAYILPWGEQRWFITWQETDQTGQKTNLAIFREGERKPEWKIQFPYPNLGPVVLDGEMCYFTTMGMVGKANLAEGKMEWQIDSMFNVYKWSFKQFSTPLVYPDKVIFIDLPERGRREKRDTVVVDPVSGLPKGK